MTKYILHLYREMKLSYADIEADTPEAAAAITRDKPTDQADSIDDCEGENLAALIDVAGDEDYSESVTIDFEAERQRKAAPMLLDALKLCHEQLSLWVADSETCEMSPEDEDALAKASYAITQAKAAGISPAPGEAALKPYSVLLLYPDDVNDGGAETYYAWVEAPDSIAAVALAQRQALATNEWVEREPDDFAPLLVTRGHHFGQPLFNK
jgi:hypothetical protein